MFAICYFSCVFQALAPPGPLNLHVLEFEIVSGVEVFVWNARVSDSGVPPFLSLLWHRIRVVEVVIAHALFKATFSDVFNTLGSYVRSVSWFALHFPSFCHVLAVVALLYRFGFSFFVGV